MATSKVILNGSTIMDVTQDTVTTGSMLSGTTAHKNDGTSITGSITSKTSSNLTASGLTVTAPAGYYASNATKTCTDANLLAENIKKDVTIFGVTGSYEGSGGGATEYTFNATSHPISHNTAFDLSNSGLTTSDLVLDDHTMIWIELTQNKTVDVWLDSEDDDDFTLTFPSGMKIMMTLSDVSQYSISYIGAFAYQASDHSKPYGYVVFYYDFNDGFLVFDSYGDLPRHGGASQDSNYNSTNGLPHLVYCPNSVLHILKY